MIDYVYPEEKEALHDLLRRKEFQAALKLFEKTYSAATEFARLKGRYYKITSVTEPRIFYLYRLAAKRLEMSADIPVYLELSDRFVPQIYGTDGKCAIVAGSMSLEQLSDPELTAMFGNALSHVKYGHVQYMNLENLTDEIFQYIPFAGGTAAAAVKALLAEWKKYAEFTADRGAAIAAGDAQAVFGYLSKCMGAPFSVHHPLSKWDQHSAGKMSGTELVAFQLLVENVPVPFGILRFEELKKWMCSDQCRNYYRSLYYGGMGETEAWDKGRDRKPMERGMQMYQEALRLWQDKRELAMILLYGAASCEVVQAQDYLARCCINGAFGIEKNDLAGLDYLKKAAGKKYPRSMFTLGCLMLKGAGAILPKNQALGFRLIRQAASEGDSEAVKWLGGNALE